MVIISLKLSLVNEKSVAKKLIRIHIVVVKIFDDNRSTSVKRIFPPFSFFFFLLIFGWQQLGEQNRNNPAYNNSVYPEVLLSFLEEDRRTSR